MTANHPAPAHVTPWNNTSALPCPEKPARTELIKQSHLRCAALGLSRVERPDFEPLMRSDLTVARERNQRLFTHAAPVMEMLFEQIVNSESMIVLTDAQGSAQYDALELPLVGRHQAANAAVALATIAELRKQGWSISDAAIRQGLTRVLWPARIEVIGRRPTMVLDVAHNVASI